MVKGYKYINIKDEVVDRIRTSEENKKEVEEGVFNLAGFVTKVLLGHLNNTYSEPPKNEGATILQIKNIVTEALNEKNKSTLQTGSSTNEERTTYHGLTKEDLAAIKSVVGEAISEAMR